MTTEGLLGAWRSWIDTGFTELAVLLAVVWFVDRLTEFRLHPRTRNALWMLVLIRLSLPPALTWTAPGAGLSLPVAGPVAAVSVTTPDGLPAALPWLFAAWLTGAICLTLGWWVRARTSRGRLRELSRADRDRLQATGGPLTAAVAPMPRVLLDPDAAAPYVTGLVKPAIVLPRDWAAWPTRALSHALEHEVMHLRRRDLWLEAAWMAAAACYWFHPLVHVARRRAHETREACCDAAVARRLGGVYRRSLLELAAGWPRLEPAAAAPPASHGWGPMVVRIRLLDRWARPMAGRARVAGALALVTGACLILPSHVRTAPPASPSFTLEQLVNPATRQESGLGSLHLRYELMRRNNLEGSSR